MLPCSTGLQILILAVFTLVTPSTCDCAVSLLNKLRGCVFYGMGDKNNLFPETVSWLGQRLLCLFHLSFLGRAQLPWSPEWDRAAPFQEVLNKSWKEELSHCFPQQGKYSWGSAPPSQPRHAWRNQLAEEERSQALHCRAGFKKPIFPTVPRLTTTQKSPQECLLPSPEVTPLSSFRAELGKPQL